MIRADLPLAVLTRLAVTALHRRLDDPPACQATARFLEAHPVPPAFERLCGHGFALRDCLALNIRPGAREIATWPDFIDHLQKGDGSWYQSLLECVICNQLDYLGYSLHEPLDLRQATAVQEVAAQLASAECDAGQIEALLLDPGGQFKENLLDLLNGYWQSVARFDEMKVGRYLDHLHQVFSLPLQEHLPSQAFVTLTGLEIPEAERQRIDRCQEVVFLIMPGQGEDVSLSYLEQRAVVAVDPRRIVRHPENVSEVFSALGRALGLKLALTLALHGEMYVSELVEFLDAPQATVSSHLSALERVNVVARRVDRRRVYYRVNPKGLDSAIATLKYLRGASPAQPEAD